MIIIHYSLSYIINNKYILYICKYLLIYYLFIRNIFIFK